MVKMLNAYTYEVTNAEAASCDILEKLDMRHNLLKNSAGLVFCYLDFIKSGALEAVCKNLPFPVLGCTTLGIAAPKAMGGIVLSLTVLTSDDVEFRAGLSEPLITDEEARIVKLYRKLSANEKSALILPFTPSLHNLVGDTVVKILDHEGGGAPIFGTGALDADTRIRTPKTIYNGKAWSDRMPLLLLMGNVEPKFFVDSVWNQDGPRQKAVVTKAEGNRIITVDGMCAAEYMKKIGLITSETRKMLFMFPLVIVSGSALPMLFVIYAVNKDGSILCSTNTPTGSTLYISFPGKDKVLSSMKNVTNALKEESGQTRLIFSCFSRSVIQTDPDDEMKMIQTELAGLPFLLTYSRGEICPVYNRKGVAVNQYHSYAIVSSVF